MTGSSKAYAEALFSLAMENRQEKAYLDALETAAGIFADEPAYADFLSSPGIPAGERTAALSAALGDVLPEQVMSFLKLLTEKRHIRMFGDCVDEYRRLYEASVALTPAEAVSAAPLTEEQKDRLREKLEKLCGGAVQLTCTVDPTLLGGLTVTLDGKILDGSLRHRLHDMKEVMHQ